MHKNIFSLSIFLFFNVLFAQTNFDNILNGVFRNQDKMDKEIRDVIFDGNFSYQESNNKGQVLKTIASRRRIYSKGYDKQKSEYSEMIINGEVLTEEQMKKELKKNRGEMQTKLPFAKDFRDKYEFTYLGEETWHNKPVWKIGYQPKHKAKDNIKGFAYILQNDTNVVQYQFIPTGLPFVLKNFNIILDYFKIEKYWVPEKFSLEMELDVKVVFSLAHKFIRMQEQYSNYKFNTNIPDSFFDTR